MKFSLVYKQMGHILATGIIETKDNLTEQQIHDLSVAILETEVGTNQQGAIRCHAEEIPSEVGAGTGTEYVSTQALEDAKTHTDADPIVRQQQAINRSRSGG